MHSGLTVIFAVVGDLSQGPVRVHYSSDCKIITRKTGTVWAVPADARVGYNHTRSLLLEAALVYTLLRGLPHRT